MAALRTNTFMFALQEVCADMIRYLEDQGCPRPLTVRNNSLGESDSSLDDSDSALVESEYSFDEDDSDY